MGLRVIGAGLGRTGTQSLKVALEQLLQGHCYNMPEVATRLDDIPIWRRACQGEYPDWNAFLVDYEAVVDWPAAAFWRELEVANPQAIVLLSVRDVDEWWDSAAQTMFSPMAFDAGRVAGFPAEWPEEVLACRFTPDWQVEEVAKAAFIRHNETVRSLADPRRLVEWRLGDGWGPICKALDLAIPETPFPHVNTRRDFQFWMDSVMA